MYAEAWCGTCNQDRLPGGGQSSLNEGRMHVGSERGRAMAWNNWIGQNGESRRGGSRRRTPGILMCHLLWAEVVLPPQPQPSTKSSGAVSPLRPFKRMWSLSHLPQVTVIQGPKAFSITNEMKRDQDLLSAYLLPHVILIT